MLLQILHIPNNQRLLLMLLSCQPCQYLTHYEQLVKCNSISCSQFRFRKSTVKSRFKQTHYVEIPRNFQIIPDQQLYPRCVLYIIRVHGEQDLIDSIDTCMHGIKITINQAYQLILLVQILSTQSSKSKQPYCYMKNIQLAKLQRLLTVYRIVQGAHYIL